MKPTGITFPSGGRLLVLVGLVLVALFVLLARIDDISIRIPTLIGIVALLFSLYAVSISLVSHSVLPRRVTLIIVFAVALAGRLALVGSTPALSDDIHRYLWEGRVVHDGGNPFLHPPNSESLVHLRDSDFSRINHPHLATIYPPLAQWAFYLGVAIAPSVATQKSLFLIFDIATLILLAVFLRSRGRDPALCIVYGWSPLVVIEFAHSGHMDSLAIFFLMLTIFLIDCRRPVLGYASMALSFLAKYFSLVLLPYFLVRKRSIVGFMVFGFLVVLGYLPFADASAGFFSSLRVYGESWNFNSLLFSLSRGIIDDPVWIRRVLAAAGIVFAVYQAVRQEDLLRYAYVVTGFALLISPTVYPWYLCWIVPFLCFFRSRAWIYLTGAIFVSYTVWTVFRETGVWQVGWWMLLVEYVPFAVLLVYDYLRVDRKERAR